MVKTNRQGSQKPDEDQASTEIPPQKAAASSPIDAATSQKKGKQSGKNRRSEIGGSAITGAKSTQIRELSNGTPSNQQPEYYNRETRRRMQQMGTGPYTDREANDPRRRRTKRQERIKERQVEIRKSAERKGVSGDIRLGRRNTYFLIGSALVIVVLIAVFLILRHPF